MLAHSACGNADDADNELADKHAHSAPDENCTTAISLNDIERNGSRADVDESGDETDEEGIFDSSQFLEECSAEVEDEVDTRPPVRCGVSSASER
jgi:hypothetical protein